MRCWTCTQNATRGNSTDKAEEMFRLHSDGKGCIMPDVISYRTLIDAWIRSWDRDSPRRVCALLKKMAQLYKCKGRDDLRPDVNGFNLILKACSHSLAMYDKATLPNRETIILSPSRQDLPHYTMSEGFVRWEFNSLATSGKCSRRRNTTDPGFSYILVSR